jgi:hypothetical protein
MIESDSATLANSLSGLLGRSYLLWTSERRGQNGVAVRRR